MKLQPAKGTHDILPASQPRWRRLHRTVEQVLERAGVEEITPPVFEYSDVFSKVGDSADLVVQKEMYTFEDRGGRSLTLRPEFTAGVLRAFVTHGMHTWPTPVKLWSRGPIFRAENVQRGRYRQFHQVNCELIGLDSPLLDAEAIALLYTTLRAAGLDGMIVKLGSVGDPADRAAYNRYLREALEPHQGDLSETSRRRLELNPLRLLDSKSPGDQALLAGLKRPLDVLNDDARIHFEEVGAALEAWSIPVEIDPQIVRGLDYYRRTAFEVHHGAIGAQSALCGGGRYDGLIEAMGGPATPGVGWAFGVERVLDALAEEGAADHAADADAAGTDLYLIPLDDDAVLEGATLAQTLRARFTVEYAYQRRNPGKGLADATRAGARYAGLRGARERATNTIQLKDLRSGAQTDVPLERLAEVLARSLAEVVARDG